MLQGLSVWFAWCQFQELNSESGTYQAADGNVGNRQGTLGGHADPFQSYVPPQGQQSTYQQDEERQPSETAQMETQKDAKSENLL